MGKKKKKEKAVKKDPSKKKSLKELYNLRNSYQGEILKLEGMKKPYQEKLKKIDTKIHKLEAPGDLRKKCDNVQRWIHEQKDFKSLGGLFDVVSSWRVPHVNLRRRIESIIFEAKNVIGGEEIVQEFINSLIEDKSWYKLASGKKKRGFTNMIKTLKEFIVRER
jgi:hypothetical protein